MLRLSKQVKRVTATIKKHVNLYNSTVRHASDDTSLPDTISLPQALDASSDIYVCLQPGLQVCSNLFIMTVQCY